MAGEFWLEITLISLLILANGFFSASEIAVISVRRSRIDQLIEEGSTSAQVVGRLKDDSDRFLATVQIGMTLVGSLASAVGGASAVEYLGPIFQQSGSPFLREWGGALAIGLVVLAISYLSLVLGELVPKTLALRYPERIACVVARPLDLFSRMFSVIVKLLTASSNLLLFFSGSGARSTEALVSEEEVKYLIREGAEKGVFDDTEKEFIHSVFDFADTSVREVLTPRTEIHALEVQTSCAEALHEMIESGFSRMPVYEEDLERIIGIVHIKELLRAQEQGQTALLRDFLHPAYFVPDSMQISHLLRELQVRRAHMAVVVNEFGTVIGLATIEDLLEEIVGEIRDEFDVDEEQPVQEIGEGVLLIEGGVALSDLKEQHNLPLEETASYRTLAGFLLARLERIPKGGETVVHEGYRLTIVNMDGRRIAKVKVEKLNADTQPAAAVRESGQRANT
ncbi:MAG: HlyC/CorC family transporter [Deltaproteobacteria bacterium]|nr:HlyC/CorC family transporter [Deltaproteobacteria bacterium]